MNRVLLLGNLSYPPEFLKTKSGVSVCNFSLKTVEHSKKPGEMKSYSEFHRCVVWGKTAETCHQYLKEGSSVFIEGKLKTDQYEKDGHKHKITKVHVDNITFLGSNPEPAEAPDDTPF